MSVNLGLAINDIAAATKIYQAAKMTIFLKSCIKHRL